MLYIARGVLFGDLLRLLGGGDFLRRSCCEKADRTRNSHCEEENGVDQKIDRVFVGVGSDLGQCADGSEERGGEEADL